MNSRTFVCLVVSIAIAYAQGVSEFRDFLDFTKIELPRDGKLSFIELANKYGHKAEEYQVNTEDGYILTIFRIPGRSPPVFLMHGILDSADTWLLRGANSLGISLANSGYDVWFGNARGNAYSRRHVTLNLDVDTEFWDFSFNEIGFYDYPAVIDKILNETGASNVSAIAHSQGNTAFYVLGTIYGGGECASTCCPTF